HARRAQTSASARALRTVALPKGNCRSAGDTQSRHGGVRQTYRVPACSRSISKWRMMAMSGFMETLREQRWDDHRFYHHSRINQSLHFISAISFVVAYGMLF